MTDETFDEAADDDVRRLLQGLPEVAPPEGFFDDLIRQRRRRARTVAVVGIVAAGVVGGVVVAQATGVTGEAAPPMSILAARHADLAGMEDDMTDEVPAPYQAPRELGGMSRGFMVHHADDLVQVVYGDEGHYLSVFEQPGELADEAMDEGLERVPVDGVEAWRAGDGSLIVRRDDVVYVLVGDLPEDEELAAVLDELPDARPLGIARRIGDAMDDLVDAFGFG
ncbi:MAG TPA: hypothetical protein VD926_03455 [Acidimicrobiales bacterium]|nr:hypothetical protein [Acidimicrobiales bacterium]